MSRCYVHSSYPCVFKSPHAKPQVQERLNIQIADAVNEVVGAKEQEPRSDGFAGLMVICDAKHMCMVARGVEKAASSTLTFAARGCLDRNAALRVRCSHS